jgi:hypothetical protein
MSLINDILYRKARNNITVTAMAVSFDVFINFREQHQYSVTGPLNFIPQLVCHTQVGPVDIFVADLPDASVMCLYKNHSDYLNARQWEQR